MKKSMNVIARKGVRVPFENASRKYITDEKAVSVKESAYYTRRIFDGDLLEVVEGGPPVEVAEAKPDGDAPASVEAPVATAKRGGKGA
ncbi:hypothetical protein PAN31117_05401 [Pandoraea anapnoica]|uniref:DUF2635 domain-containing protein n=1 Tax=Pandoraea anapnoica TaxID=2508301 RepID=A0A5E5AW16_9BURK|nr:hypothetical protein [Pandoraea anapnoica]VVE76463.1 hypothetical protein PAN31117_05401 [Pandoraea anapnoica]